MICNLGSTPIYAFLDGVVWTANRIPMRLGYEEDDDSAVYY